MVTYVCGVFAYTCLKKQVLHTKKTLETPTIVGVLLPFACLGKQLDCKQVVSISNMMHANDDPNCLKTIFCDNQSAFKQKTGVKCLEDDND